MIRNLESLVDEGRELVVKSERVGNTLFGNARWVREQIRLFNPSRIVVLDPQLFGLPGFIGIVSLFRLKHLQRKMGFKVSVALFDLVDPQASLFGVWLSILRARILLICSTADEARDHFGIRGARGPAIEACVGDFPTSRRRLSERRLEVHLPRPSYEPRRTIVHELKSRLAAEGISFSIGGSFETSEDLLGALRDTKVVVVTNDLAVGGVGAFPLPSGPRRHLVSYNAEASCTGALVLTQACPAYASYFKPGEDSLAFDDVEDCFAQLKSILKDDRASEEIAERGFEAMRKLSVVQPGLCWLLGHDPS